MENPFAAINPGLAGFSSESVAADVTSLISASSFVSSFSGRQDRSHHAFEAVATDFCSGSRLFLPVPKGEPGGGALFLDLWSRESATIIQHAELKDYDFEKVNEALSLPLEKFIEGCPEWVAKWVAFQFTSGVVTNHLERSDVSAIQRAGLRAAMLLEQGRFREFSKSLAAEKIDVPDDYLSLTGNARIPTLLHLYVAYAMSVAMRRFSYALKVGLQPEKPIFRYHWIGQPILNNDFLLTTKSELDRVPLYRFPWGAILRNFMEAERLSQPLEPEKVKDILVGLRKMAQDFQIKYAKLPPVRKDGRSSKIKERERLVIETLLRVGVAPRYHKNLRTEKLAGWLRELAAYVPKTKSWIDTVTANLQPSWLRRTEAKLRIRFRKDTFWDVFENPGVPRE